MSKRRPWLLRAIAVLLGISVFPLAELACVLLSWGQPSAYDDPYVGFSAIHPLFVLNADGTRYFIPPSRRRFFAPESFPARKPPGTFRIFCLGGSTVQGHPYSKETSFTTFLQLGLAEAQPTRSWEVINCGGVSYASYRLVPILQECLNYEPDLFVICTGHNEFLEDRTYGHVKRGWLTGRAWLTDWRVVVLLREGYRRMARFAAASAPDQRPILAADADPLLDYHRGLRAYHHDPEWKAGVVEHFEANLRRMVALARGRGVPLVFIREASNLSDCPPFKSEHRPGLSPAELAAWETHFSRAQDLYRTNLPQAIAELEAAARLDDQYAATFYELGQCLVSQRQYAAAREAFVRARDVDVCPLRMISPLEERMERVSRDTRTPLVDAHALLEARTATGILGGDLLCDHVHPSFEGHQHLADALIELMIAQRWVQPVANWRHQAHASYRRHFAALDEMYFLRGQRTLNSVRAWTQGRAGGPPIESRAPHRLRSSATEECGEES
jgi:lysophospholipase L1-like esterase